jgi:hypothetical protein
MQTTAAQLDMFAAPPAVEVEREPDALVERLVSSGLVANEYLLNLNASLSVARDDLPSRLFQFPVEFVSRDRTEDESRLLLVHPDLACFPFVDEIEAKAGVRPVWEPLDEFGRDRGSNWRYFHAVDLLTDKHWRDLIATRNFTDNKAIVLGLCFHMDYGNLSTENARAVLGEIGSTEPSDKSADFLHSPRVKVTHCQQGKFVGFDRRDHLSIWAAVHGLEAKIFKRSRNGHLQFSPSFLAEKEAA